MKTARVQKQVGTTPGSLRLLTVYEPPGYTDRPLSMATDDMTTQQAEPGVWVTGPDGELVPDYESTFPEINEGQVVHGTVVRVDKVEVLVLTKEDAEGRLILSKKRARFELAWKRIEAAAESGEPVDGRVIEVVKGGLILDLGVRGFLPASLVDIRRVQDLEEFL